ncbi:dipeptidase [Myxococcota bacterium]|nr:dipeptidase [Myxococcota bacterium]
MRNTIAVAGALLSVVACAGGKPRQDANGADAAWELHRTAIVVDTHSDTTPRFEDPEWDFLQRHDPSDGHMDLPRMREGGLDVQFWSIYMGQREGEGRAIREALQRIDAVHRLVDQHPDELGLATNVEEIRKLVAEGRIACLMGVEGGHIIENDLAALRSFYRLGVRYLTLTHSFHTDWADSSGTGRDLEPLHHGLTEFGEEVVLTMNRLGMMVDVSHVSDETFSDVLAVSRAPVIASHSSARAVANHRRNVSDDMLRALAENGGVIMINFYPVYIDEEANRAADAYYQKWGRRMAEIQKAHADDPKARAKAYRAQTSAHPLPQTSFDVLLDHFDHAIVVAGPDHVGIGADWDGVPSMPVGMEDVTFLPELTRGLLGRGHSPEVVRKVLGENLLRVMAEVETVAEHLREEMSAESAPSHP